MRETEKAMKHWADKPILRDLLWFLVLPHQLRLWVTRNRERRNTAGSGKP